MNKITPVFKILTILIFSSFLIFKSYSQVTIFGEDFESDVSLWGLENQSGNTVNWSQNLDLQHGGSACAQNDYNVSDNNILFTSDPINLTLISNPVLTFWHIAKTESGFDKCYVEVSTDNGATWLSLKPLYTGASTAYQTNGYFDELSYGTEAWGNTNIYFPDNTWWKQETFNLNSISSENDVKIRFKLVSDSFNDNSAGWFIDDIKIKGNSVYNTNSKIEAGAAIEPTTISSVENSAPGVMVFDFILTDLGGGDLVPTIIDKLTITQGTANDFVDWAMAIEGATLTGPDLTNYAGTVSSNQISFIGDNFISIADGVANAETYELRIWLKPNYIGGSEGSNFQFKISNVDIINDPTGSFFGSYNVSSTSTLNELDVIVTSISFIQQPTNTAINNNMLPAVTVAGTDIFGNIDKDFNGNVIELTSSGSMIGSPLSSDPTVNGVATFSMVKHGVLGTDFKLYATYNSWTDSSNLFNIIPNSCNIQSNPPAFEGELKMCLGENQVQFKGLYTGPGTPSYYWELGDGHTTTGQIVDQVYNEAYGYNVKLVVTTETTYCETELKVMVSPGPVIVDIVDNITFCLGSSYDLSAGADGTTVEVTYYEGAGITALSLADTTYLPDSDDNEFYTTTLTYTQFPPTATLPDTDFLTVYADMEHSYFGDLEIEITCPNGSNVHMQNGYYGDHDHSGAFLGEPVYLGSVDDGIPGDGYEYRWTTNNPQFGTMEETPASYHTYTDVDGNTHTNQAYMPAGSYLPYDGFGPLLGCPLNGNWTITVTDNIGRDDGFIFEWGLELDPSLMPSNWDYETYIISYAWGGPETITGTGANVNITPITPGNNTYTLTVRDNYGCVTQQSLNINVTEGFPYSIPDVNICETSATIDAGAGYISYQWTNNLGQIIGTDQFLTVTQSGIYTITISDGECNSYDVVNVTLGAFTYASPPDPAPFCEGAGIQIDAGAGYSAYQWSLGGSVVATTRKYTPSISGTYVITVKNSYGCYSSDEIVVTVNPKPVLNVISTDPDNVICAGEGITLTANGADTYTWNNGISNGVEFFPQLSRTYTVTGSYSLTGCSASTSVQVVVYDTPAISLDDVFSCGTTAFLDAGSGFTTYEWINPANETISYEQSVLVDVAGTYITEIYNGHCYNTDTIEVTLGSYSYTAPEDPETFCDGGSANLNAGDGYLSYEWTLNSVVIGSEQNLTALDAGTYIITVQLTDDCALSDQVVVTTYELPEIEILSSDLDNIVCIGDGIVLTCNGTDIYNWEAPINNGVEFFPATTDTYTVTATDVHSCQNSEDITITVALLPEIEIADNSYCAEHSVTINAGSGFESYGWIFEGTTIGTLQSITISQFGTYTITVEDENGCINSDDFYITENANPTISINDATICDSGNHLFDAGISFETYSWTNSSGDVIGENPIINLTEEGTYFITVENELGCFATDEFILTVNPLPNAFAGNDIELCNGESAILSATGGTDYDWNNGVIQNQEFIPSQTATYTVVVYNEFNCSSSDNVIITVHENPVLEIAENEAICYGDTISLDAGSGFAIYDWSTGASTQAISVSTDGTYSLTVYNQYACSATKNITLTVNPLPVIEEIYTSNIDQITIVATADTTLFYSIDDGFTFEEENIFSHLAPGYYTVTVKDANNCLLKQIHLLDITEIFIPQFFTPNFDGTNDTWEIGGIRAFPDAVIEVYDRFGKLLTTYGSNDEGWDGTYREKVMPSDSYWYVIDLKFENRVYSGFVTLKRNYPNN